MLRRRIPDYAASGSAPSQDTQSSGVSVSMPVNSGEIRKLWGNVMRRMIFATGAVALLASVPQASGGTIAQSCYDKACEINFSGEIQSGDNQRIAHFVQTARLHVDSLEISSPGGDPFEALRISAVLNKYFIEIFPDKECASACALLFLTTDMRFKWADVYLHRPTFPSEMFNKMTAPQAKAAYQAAVSELLSELRQRGVQNDQIELMMSIPSDDVRPLDKYYPERSPWMEEWLAARCGSFASVERDAPLESKKWLPAESARIRCEFNTIEAAQRDAQHKP